MVTVHLLRSSMLWGVGSGKTSAPAELTSQLHEHLEKQPGVRGGGEKRRVAVPFLVRGREKAMLAAAAKTQRRQQSQSRGEQSKRGERKCVFFPAGQTYLVQLGKS